MKQPPMPPVMPDVEASGMREGSKREEAADRLENSREAPVMPARKAPPKRSHLTHHDHL